MSRSGCFLVILLGSYVQIFSHRRGLDIIIIEPYGMPNGASLRLEQASWVVAIKVAAGTFKERFGLPEP